MYFNVFGEKVSRKTHKEMLNAAKNRRELIAAGLDRRELFKMGLLTSAGYLVAKSGLSARRGSGLIPDLQAQSPSITPFVRPLPIMPQAAATQLHPAPTISPNTQ